uniref:Sugar phosphate phosphatase n=1 Tax=Timema cristinae TaxID=61476 RepID=A0A7R9DHI9_TIMCR|nr:unnamed protein product [Timema cristinae]
MLFNTQGILDTVTPPNAFLSAKFKRSFAYVTVKDRLPVIITQVVDHLARDKDKIIKEYGEDAREEVKTVIGRLSELKNELQTNKPLIELKSRKRDAYQWNTFLEDQRKAGHQEPRWFGTVWLYAECYMYRRMWQIFELTQSLAQFDYFRKLKRNSLMFSLDGCVTVCDRLVIELNRQKVPLSEVKEMFGRILKVCAILPTSLVLDWIANGGEIEVKILAGCTEGGFPLYIHANAVSSGPTSDPLDLAPHNQDYLLVDQSELIWDTLTGTPNTNHLLDFVLDNAGFELFADLCLADFLCTFGLVSKIRFHAKTMPWFVSDAMLGDVKWTVNTLGEVGSYSQSVPELASRWQGYIKSGVWELLASDFWTLPYVFSAMEKKDPNLYDLLRESSLVLFKGDLNYRKLTGETNWPPTHSFHTALKGFHPTNVAILRTLKADTVCGLGPGQAEMAEEKDTDWNLTGTITLPPTVTNVAGTITLPPIVTNVAGTITLPPTVTNVAGTITLPPIVTNVAGTITLPPIVTMSGHTL